MLCFLLCPYLQVPQGTESAGWFPLTKLFKGSSICRKFRDPRNNYYLYITSCPGLPGVNHGDSDAVIPSAPIRLGRESSSSAAHQYWNIRVEQFSMLTCKIFRDFMPDILGYIFVIVQQHHTDVKHRNKQMCHFDCHELSCTNRKKLKKIGFRLLVQETFSRFESYMRCFWDFNTNHNKEIGLR